MKNILYNDTEIIIGQNSKENWNILDKYSSNLLPRGPLGPILSVILINGWGVISEIFTSLLPGKDVWGAITTNSPVSIVIDFISL